MAKKAKPVTLAEIKAKIPDALKHSKEKGQRQSIGAGSGTMLAVFPSGTMKWYGRVVSVNRDATGKNKKKTMWIPLGLFTMDLMTKETSGMSLETARKKAAEVIRKAKKTPAMPGLQPSDDSGPTLAEYWPQFVRIKLDQGKDPKGRLRNSTTIFNRHLAPLHGIRLANIKPATVTPLIQELDTSQWNKADAVNLLKQILDMAVNQGILTFNSCYALNKIFKRPKTIGYPWVEADRLADCFFKPLSTVPVLYRFYYLMIALTGTRKTEMLNLRWSWVDETKGVITAPAEKTKMKKVHEMPISPQIASVLSKLKEYCKAMPKSDVVFQSPRNPDAPIGNVIQYPVTAQCSGVCCLHGFRKSINTWMVDNGISETVADLFLSHETRNKVQKAYNHAEYRKEIREAGDRWDAYLETQLPPAYLELIHGMK